MAVKPESERLLQRSIHLVRECNELSEPPHTQGRKNMLAERAAELEEVKARIRQLVDQSNEASLK